MLPFRTVITVPAMIRHLQRTSSVCATRGNVVCARNYSRTKVYRQAEQQTNKSKAKESTEDSNMKMAYYVGTIAMFVFGLSYASVPLYKVFCQVTGFGGTTQVATEEQARKVEPVEGAKIIKIYFAANVHSEMPWKFTPTQSSIKIVPGETALAFYTVKNKSDKAITGIATYNVHPPKAGLYFNKIQCFCFEEQRLNPHEEIDMPVFFFVDPEFVQDPAMDNVNHITLSYTFFKTGEEEVVSKKKEVVVPAVENETVTKAKV
eukprot:gene16074-18147_t